MSSFAPELQTLQERLQAAKRITVLTGAGISAASGVPTFRGDGGLWRNHRSQDLATPQAFERDPKLVWEFYQWRRNKVSHCRPNAAHEVLAEWSRHPDGFQLITQNVDGLHELADTRNVVRFHGTLWELSCWRRCPESPQSWEDRSDSLPPLPQCPFCGGLARPAVVWFGEPIAPHVLQNAAAALHCDVFITIGTSALVYPAAGLIEQAAREGAYTAEINPEATPASRFVDLPIAASAEKFLPLLEKFRI